MSSMATMNAAVYRRRGEVEVVELPVLSDPPGQAVVAVEYCGICGTDLHMMLDGWGTPNSVFGHEWSGRIIEPGTSAFEPGRLVVGLPSPACGTCGPCLADRPSLCRQRPQAGASPERGAFAELVHADGDRLVAVPDGIDARAAAYTEPLAVALHAIALSGISDGQTALVMGAGPIGAAIIAVLDAKGIATAAIEPGEPRRRLAERLGATPRLADELEVTDHPGDVPGDAVDVVFETSGARVATELGLTQLSPGGALVLVGTGLDSPTLDANRVILNELRIIGAFNYDPGGFDAALALIGSGRLPLAELIAPESAALGDLVPTMQLLRAGQIPGKVMVRP